MYTLTYMYIHITYIYICMYIYIYITEGYIVATTCKGNWGF